MSRGLARVPVPANEPVRDYAPGSRERASLKARLGQMLSERVEIPLIVGGKEVRTGRTRNVVCPHDHGHVLAEVHQAGPAEVEHAVRSALQNQTKVPDRDEYVRMCFLRFCLHVGKQLRCLVNHWNCPVFVVLRLPLQDLLRFLAYSN